RLIPRSEVSSSSTSARMIQSPFIHGRGRRLEGAAVIVQSSGYSLSYEAGLRAAWAKGWGLSVRHPGELLHEADDDREILVPPLCHRGRVHLFGRRRGGHGDGDLGGLPHDQAEILVHEREGKQSRIPIALHVRQLRRLTRRHHG